MPTNPGPPGSSSGLDDMVLWALALAGGLGATVWAGAQLAVLAVHHRRLPMGLAGAVQAGFALPGHASRPAGAWPAPADQLIPGPLVYWLATAVAAVAAVAVVALAVAAHRLFARPAPGTERRRRLGVDTRARLARPRDLAPLIVDGPSPGRLIVGQVDGHLVATETRARSRRRRAHRGRRGDRSAVAVIGPTRCGKTANIISGILDWDGPAILSSLRDDLLDATLARRRALGEVKVFDPTGVSGQDTSRWSPLRDAATPTGAQKAARSLLAAYSRPGGREDVEFFGDLGTAFLASLFYVAAVSGRTMSDVVRWVMTRDRPTTKDRGDLGRLVDLQLASDDQHTREWAAIAHNGLKAVWANDERTTSGIYITTQRMLGIWQDPLVAAACQACDIDLEWLVSAKNTLYICGPLNEQDRLAVLFGGVLSDLIEQQAYEWTARRRRPLPDLLVVLDEAANTPTRWLPNVASTCSGLGMLLVTIWQSKVQIEAAYGTLADSVLTNHGTKIIFSGVSDLSTLDYASRLVGDEEVRQHAVSTDMARGGRSLNESTTRVRLLPSDILRQAPPGDALLIHGTLPPAHLHARPYYRDRRLARMATTGRAPSLRRSSSVADERAS
jgi:type IV secretion system protein VirD4